MNATTIATFNSESPARALRERLESAGIPAVVVNERRLQLLWFWSKPFASVHVKVDTSEAEKANELATQWDRTDGILREAIRCPECGSSRVEYPQMTRQFFLPTLIAHSLWLFGLVPHRCYCRNCHNIWRPEETPRAAGSTTRPAHSDAVG